MPCPAMHCRICAKQGKTWTARGSNFAERMASLRRHRKQEHPKAHKESVKKALRTKQYDPIHPRRRLISKPEVLSHKDTKAYGLIRVLTRARDYFPEFALYPKQRFEHKALKDAGLREEQPRKWVLRTDKFSIFVYI